MLHMTKHLLLGLAVLYVVWTIFKALMNWSDARIERKR